MLYIFAYVYTIYISGQNTRRKSFGSFWSGKRRYYLKTLYMFLDVVRFIGGQILYRAEKKGIMPIPTYVVRNVHLFHPS